MSVTISINNNYNYVNENCPELIQVEELGSPEDGESFTATYYPFEINLANGNFGALWFSLGLEAEQCGEMRPEELLGRLNNLVPAKLVTETVIEESPWGGTTISCGRSLEQVTRYYWFLRQIAAEAIKRGELIVWA